MAEDRAGDVIVILVVTLILMLKCTGVLQISWFWLTSFIWIPLLLGIILAAILMLAYAIHLLVNKLKGENK